MTELGGALEGIWARRARCVAGAAVVPPGARSVAACFCVGWSGHRVSVLFRRCARLWLPGISIRLVGCPCCGVKLP